MRKLFLLCILLGSQFGFGQRQFKFGGEFNANVSTYKTYQRNALAGLNFFAWYKVHEMYIGFDVFRLFYKPTRTWGCEAGYKFHIQRVNRKSNVTVDLNFQYSRYSKGCVGPVPYNFIPKEPGDGCLAMGRIKAQILSAGIGYELFYTKWLSSLFTIGPSIGWGVKSRNIYSPDNYFYYPSQDWAGLPVKWGLLGKASIRFIF